MITAAALITAGGVVTAVAPAGAAPANPAGATAASARHAVASGPGHGLTWSGPWHAGTSYSAGDVVSYQGASYVANGPSTGRVPSLSPRAWTVLAAAGLVGPRGPAGPAGDGGPQGPAGTTQFAEFYAQPTVPILVAPGAEVAFGQNGEAGGSAISRFVCSPSSEFQFHQSGIYEVSFQFHVLDGAAALELDNTVLAATIVGTDSASQLVGDSLIRVNAGDWLSVVSQSFAAIVIEPTVFGSAQTLTDSLVIKQLSVTPPTAPRRGGAGVLPAPGTGRQARRHRGC